MLASLYISRRLYDTTNGGHAICITPVPRARPLLSGAFGTSAALPARAWSVASQPLAKKIKSVGGEI